MSVQTRSRSPLPTASASSYAFHELLEDSKSPGVSDPVSHLPDPPQPSDQGWHVSISPYLWLPGLHGTIGALGHDASVTQVSVTSFPISRFALMGAVETSIQPHRDAALISCG